MKNMFSFLIIMCLLFLSTGGIALAQSDNELELGMSRDFGYSGFGNDIQGLFTIKVKNAPANLTRVEFFVDTTSMGEDTQPPFSLQFNTDSYPLGAHTLSAIGYTSDGSQINSKKIQSQFVPASSATDMIAKILVPVLGLIVLMVIVSVLLPIILNKGKLSSMPLGTARKYGIGGGAVCPKCGRPFPLRLWWINLGFNKIDRCPYCGKWSFLRPRSLNDLRAAEAAELAQAQPDHPITGEFDSDKLKKDLDDSRFQNL